MPESRKPPKERSPARHGAAVALLLLLPLLAFGGAIAPGLVSVHADAAAEVGAAVEGAAAPSIPNIRLRRRPLLLRRSSFFDAVVPDIDRLFVGSTPNPVASPETVQQRFASLPSFPPSKGDMIVLAEMGEVVTQRLFDDVLRPTSVADASGLFTPSVWDAIPDLTGPGTGYLFDDFAGTGGPPPLPPPAVVPEPSTGLLLAMGLAVLSYARRRQRQPATS